MIRTQRGFTLIELLIVVVIIGLLAAIALPKFAYTKEQAFISTMKSDLRNLATAQTAFEADNGAFYNGAIPNAALVYNPGANVTITVSNVTATGWGATATHSGTSRVCAIYFGNGGPLAPATAEGQAACN